MNKKNIVLDTQERKKIWYWRKNGSEQRKEHESRGDNKNENLAKDIMKRAVPSFDKYMDEMDKAANSAWFALSEIERGSQHWEDNHKNNGTECIEGCLEDWTLEDGKEYVRILVEETLKHLEQEDNK